MNVDFHHVEEKHNAIHSALLNWSRWVSVRHNIGHVHPMWAKSRSNAWQWHQPVQRESTNSRKSLGFTGPELQSMREAYDYHDMQRQSISRAQYEQAIKKTADRIRSAHPDLKVFA